MAVSGSGKGSGGGSKGIRAGRAFVELSADDAGLRSKLEKARAMVMKFGRSMAAVGGGLLGAGGGALAPIAGVFGKIVDKGTELSRLGDKLGVPVSQLSEFAYAAETTGQSLEDLSGHFENLAERVAQGALGSGEAADTFKRLGIDAAALKLQNPVDQLISLAEAMQGVTNETERLGMLSSLGGDQFQNLNALFKQGPAGIRALMGEARDVGASMSDETGKAAQRASGAFNRAWASIKGSVLSVGEALLGNVEAIEEFSRVIVGVARSVRLFISENKSLVLGVASVGAALATGGVALVGIGAAMSAAAMAVSGFAAVLGAVFSPMGAVVAGVAALTAGVGYLGYKLLTTTETGQSVASTFGNALRELWSVFKATWGGIIDAVKSGDLNLAWQIATGGVTVVWRNFTTGLVRIWNDFLGYLTSSTRKAFERVADYLPSWGGFDEWFGGLGAQTETFLNARLQADLERFRAEREQAQADLNRLIAQAAAQVNRPAGAAAAPERSGSAIAKFMGGAKGTFSAPDYRQFFGGAGIEQKQLKAQVDAVAELKKMNKRVGPLVFQ